MSSGNHPLRICVLKEEGMDIARSIHEGGDEAHQGQKILCLQVSRQGYFWPRLRKDKRNNIEM